MRSLALGQGLRRWFALATVLGMVVFGLVVAGAVYVHELYDPTLDATPREIVHSLGVAFAIAMPLAIALALVLGRNRIGAITGRLDDVIAIASRMGGAGERLPVGPAMDELDRLAVALNGAFDRVERGVAAQAQFNADASHELRTPLTVISTELEVARRRERTPGQWEKVADEVLVEVRRMQELIEKLLALSRMGGVSIRPRRTDLRELMVDAVTRARAIAAEHEVRVELEAAAAIDASIDPEAISIVFDNLLRNAIEHSPRGETVIARIEVGPRIAVEDRGPGVPPEQRQRIFQPFARGIHTTDRARGNGVGLGLTLCARIVSKHAGSITIEDRPGGGARFVVALA